MDLNFRGSPCRHIVLDCYCRFKPFYDGGDISTDNDTYSSKRVFTYEYPSSKWTAPSIAGDSIPNRQQMSGVIDSYGTIYIFGGMSSQKLYKDMSTLNTSSMTWKNLQIFLHRAVTIRQIFYQMELLFILVDRYTMIKMSPL